ncbi:TonB-dependent receptor [Aliifodinibius sp. S!AR15-10]|uniref:SusC/RagA family TonB-linked outer membrane protein n=1 Tax=Aliifodinibius sp. S!AR15-10 TaxID=2950437 RepID=UPI00285971A3|nr:TonB-dependent receptor [Aliifodinibius sp. S!AR15-10]MDR8393986.1 TonB-dependent receptor [Aliifodinibius sp. S!AR15-10]
MNNYIRTTLKLLVVLPFLLLWHLNSFAQHQVTGTVIDATDKTPLAGVNIVIRGTTLGTSTDENGEYSLNAGSETDTLMVSFVGYETQAIPINGRSQIDVELVSQTFEGEELVVVGYGTQRREDVTSAVTSVSSDEFIQSSPRDAASLIQSKVPGLSITAPSGDPTEGTNISLRGTTTLAASTDPLVIIDGIPGELNTVPPEDIESIDVLKDGSAAAIYGSRGSNGVILITTKSRQTDAPTRIQYDGYVNVQTIHKAPDMLDAEGVRQWIDEYQQLQDLGYDTDWLDVITRTPVSHTHNMSFSGGSAQTNYTASLNYRNLQGLFIRSDNEQITGRFNVRHSMLEDQLTADLNVITRSQNYFTGADGGSFNAFAYRNALTRNPTDRPRDDEGNYVYRSGFEYENPLVLINEVNGENVERELRLNGTLTYDPIEQLSIQLLGSFNQWNETRGYAETFKHVSAVEGGNEGFASRGTGTNEDKLLELTGTFNETLGDHVFTLLGGYSYQEVIEEDYWMQNYNFPTDAYGFNRMQSGNALPEGEASMNSFKESFKLIGFFSRLNYTFDNKYIVMGSLRYEGNSKFGADHKWGLFPAASVGWRISEEAFMSEVDFVSSLKIRAGFGVTGIAPSDAYLSLPSLQFGDRIYNNGEWVQGVSPARNANPDLRWERKEEINLGVDFSLFDDRLSGNLDIYRRDTKDMLWDYDVPVPPNVFGSIRANVGQMRNEGIELGLQYEIVRGNEFTWITNVTGSTNQNELVTLSNELYETSNDFFYTGYTQPPIQLPTHRVEIGGAIGNFYGFKSVDVSDDGKWIVEDKDGNPVSQTNASLDDRHVLGNGIPDYNLGWNHSVRYKNFDLSVTMRGAFGHQILNYQRMFYENPTLTPENVLESAFEPVFGKTRLNTGLAYVSYYVEDGDYWKLDNATLGYTFDVTTLGFVQNARVYFSGSNLLTITGYKGMDPEVDISGLDPGNDPRDKYPTTRTFTLGVNLTF